MSPAYTWFRWLVLAGFVGTNLIALPGVFVPGAVIRLLGLTLATHPVWPAFAFLLMFLVTWFYIPAALAPAENWPTAILTVVSRFAFAAFWFLIYPRFVSGVPGIAWIELLLAVLQLAFLIAIARDRLLMETSVPARSPIHSTES